MRSSQQAKEFHSKLIGRYGELGNLREGHNHISHIRLYVYKGPRGCCNVNGRLGSRGVLGGNSIAYISGGDFIALKICLSFCLSFKRKLNQFFKRTFITAFLQFIHMSLENGTLKWFFKQNFKRKFMQLNCHPDCRYDTRQRGHNA